MHISDVVETLYSHSSKQCFVFNNKGDIVINRKKESKPVVQFSKGREIAIPSNTLKHLQEGLNIIYYDIFLEEYITVPVNSPSLLWARIKGKVGCNLDAPAKRPTAVKLAIEKDSERYIEIMKELYGVTGDVSDYTFNTTATVNRNVYHERKDIVTLIEESIQLPTPNVSLNDEEMEYFKKSERMLVYAFLNLDTPKTVEIVDMCSLLEDHTLALSEIEPIFTNTRRQTIHNSTEYINTTVRKTLTKEEIKQSASRVKALSDIMGNRVRIETKEFMPPDPDTKWKDYTQEEVYDFMKHKSFTDIKVLEDGTVAAIRPCYRGFSLFVGVTSDTDFIRHPSYRYRTIHSACRDLDMIISASDVPPNGELCIIEI